MDKISEIITSINNQTDDCLPTTREDESQTIIADDQSDNSDFDIIELMNDTNEINSGILNFFSFFLFLCF